MKSSKLYLLTILCSSSFLLSGQELVSPFGVTLSSSSASMDASIGEIATATLSNENSIITQGIHQYYLQAIPLNVTSFSTNWNPIIYPNPVRDQLTIDHNSLGMVSVLVYDLNGRLVMDEELTQDGDKLATDKLADGTYTLILKDLSTNNFKNYLLIKRK